MSLPETLLRRLVKYRRKLAEQEAKRQSLPRPSRARLSFQIEARKRWIQDIEEALARQAR
jgi:hypothetical protein